MPQQSVQLNSPTSPLPPIVLREAARSPWHHQYVPNFKSKSKSRASSHVMEFLSRVFCAEGASRFFKTFMLRFVSDSNKGDDSSATLSHCTALAMAA